MPPSYANTIQSTFSKRIISPKSMTSESHKNIFGRLAWNALHLFSQSSDKILQQFVHSCSKHVSQSSLHPAVIFLMCCQQSKIYMLFPQNFTVSPCILYHKVLFVPTYALVLSTLKSLKTLLLKIILHVSIFQDHHQGFFHSLPR